MSMRKGWRLFLCCSAVLTLAYAFQRPFREYPGDEYENFPLPPDAKEKTEWVFGRLMYPPAPGYRRGRGYFRAAGRDWTQGFSSWTNDYPRADRHFAQAVRRLTRISVRSVEQPINLDDGDDVYNWPWLYAVQVGQWRLTDLQAARLRDYLLRGGFLMCEDFWGTREWAIFEETLRRVFPDRPIVDLPDSDAIFHTVFNLDDRYQVPGEWSLRSGVPYRNGGVDPHWRGVYDDKGRLLVAICFNSDVGDSWEWADYPEYPERYSALGIRIGIDYIVYSMTH
jgi:hypothetical protein